MIARVPERFSTARLVAGPMSDDDFDGLRLLHRDPVVMRTLSATGEPLGEDETRGFIERCRDHWLQHGFGVWTFRLEFSDTFIGYCGLKRTTIEDEACIELLYAVRASHWGQGYASEMAAAVVRLGLDKLGADSLVSFTLPVNAASRRVMEKQGFVYEKDIVHAGLPHVFLRRRPIPAEAGGVPPA